MSDRLTLNGIGDFRRRQWTHHHFGDAILPIHSCKENRIVSGQELVHGSLRTGVQHRENGGTGSCVELQISCPVRPSHWHKECSDSLLFGVWEVSQFCGPCVVGLLLTRNILAEKWRIVSHVGIAERVAKLPCTSIPESTLPFYQLCE